MKKILLSAVSVMACMSMSAAVPQLQDQFTGSIAVKQEAPNYSNPSTYDTDGNLIMTGAFNDAFGSLDAIGTSAYIIKYDKTNKEAWRVGLKGAATITSITTDDLDNIYVAGIFADLVEFGTTSGTPIEKEGMKSYGEYVSTKCASFIAKYDKSGAVKGVETFIASPIAYDTDLEYWGFADDIRFRINKVQISGNRIYASAIYTGETTMGDAKFVGNYLDMAGFACLDNAAGAVFSMSTDLTDCQNEVTFRCAYEKSTAEQETVMSINFDIKDGIYAGFSGAGKFNITYNGGATTSVNLPNYDETNGDLEVGYVFVSPNSSSEPIVISTMTSARPGYLNVEEMAIAGSKLYAVGTYMGAKDKPSYMPEAKLPAEGAGKYPSVSSRLFVSTIDLGSFSLASTDVYEYSEDVTNDFNPMSAGVIDGALYINYNIIKYATTNDVVANNSIWFDGTAFTAAPVAATGIAVGSVDGKGVVALPSSNATALDYKTFTFVQTGIENIGADFDENAPVEYFNLQGIRVANPENGLYIRRQGNKVEKVIVK